MSGKKGKTGELTLNSISDIILSSQSRDIQLYTEGHLNEAHLWKPPADVFHNPWESANKPHILMRPAHYINNNETVEKNINKMSNGLVDFTISDPLRNQSKLNEASVKKDIYVEELKLPDILVANKSPKIRDPKAKTQLSFDYEKLPKLTTHLSFNGEFPKTDLEVAFDMLHDPLSGATKKEKFKNLKKFEQNVIQKSDLTNSNVLFDTKKVKDLESKLEQVSLQKF